MATTKKTLDIPQRWWQFLENAPGCFRTQTSRLPGRLYFPLMNESDGLSWTSPNLHGGLVLNHHAHLAPPLTVEDLPHSLIRREFWLVEENDEPFSLSGLSPEGLSAPRKAAAMIEAGPGWFRLIRQKPGKFTVSGTLWCPADRNDCVELFSIEVANTSGHLLKFSPYAMIPLFARSADNVRDHRHVTALLHRIDVRRNRVTVTPTMSFDERGHKINRLRYSVIASGPSAANPQAAWGLEEEFIGEAGSLAAPRAVWNRELFPASKTTRLAGKEAIAGFRFAPLVLKPGKRVQFLLLSGISENAQAASRWFGWIKKPGNAEKSLKKTRAHWQSITNQPSFQTPDAQLNQWLSWVNLQPTLRRLYGNSTLPQFDYGRGGRGWRDLWQDCLALLLSDPEKVKPLLLHNFGGIRIDGSNATIIGKYGEFIADRNAIPRTWMDHGAWPLYTTFLYIHQTGDVRFLLKSRSYFRDPQIFRCRKQDPAWNEAYGFALKTRRGKVYQGSLFEHLLIQQLTAFFNVGTHNLCRLEGADWNDGLDRAAQRGESVAFSAFYAWNLGRLAILAQTLAAYGARKLDLAEEVVFLLDRLPGRRRINYASASAKQRHLQQYLQKVARDISGKTVAVSAEDLARDLRAKEQDLSRRIAKQEWIGAGDSHWFNGYYDNQGRRVEGRHAKGVRITLTGQVFALMGGIASENQVDETVRAVNRFLRDPKSGGIRLNTDFGQLQPDLGRAFSFAYGEKENGAVFSHMAVMYAYALYARRRAVEGRKVWSTLYRMADQPAAKIFPCLPEYFNNEGRGMYSYLTGSASWLIHLLLTQVYGVRGKLGDLVIDPQLDRQDFDKNSEAAVSLRFAGRLLHIHFNNPKRLNTGRYAVKSVALNQTPVRFEKQAGGGIRLRRSRLTALHKNKPAHLRVGLG